jgi:hypothetical protein
MFNLFANRNGHTRRAMELLKEAQLARIEHQAAAEHHDALARMYTERVARLEREICESMSIPLEAGARIGLEERPMLYALDANRLGPQTKT